MTWSSSRATRARRPARPTVTRCRSPRTPPPSSPRRCRASTPSSSGHAHVEIAERFVKNKETGDEVLLSEPHKWGMRLTVMDFDLARQRRPLDGRRQARDAAQRQHGARGRRGRRPAAAGPRHRHHLRQLRHRAVRHRHVGGDGPLRGHRRPRLHQLRAVPRRARRPRRHARGQPADALHRRPVQPRSRDPGGRRDGPRRGRPVHLRQHAAGHQVHRCPGQGLPRVLGELLQEGRRPGPLRARRRDQRRDADRPQRDAGLQLRRDERTRRLAVLRHRHRPGPGQQDHQPGLRRQADRPRRRVRHRDQQLPAVRWRQLPGRQDRTGALQRPGRDPSARSSTGSPPRASSTPSRSRSTTGSSSRTASRSWWRAQPRAAATEPCPRDGGQRAPGAGRRAAGPRGGPRGARQPPGAPAARRSRGGAPPRRARRVRRPTACSRGSRRRWWSTPPTGRTTGR